MDSTEKQREEQWEKNIKPWQFKPGVSGNPGGRPKGVTTLKEFAKKYLRELDDKEKLEFLTGMDKDKIWEMGEDKAGQGVQVTGEITSKIIRLDV